MKTAKICETRVDARHTRDFLMKNGVPAIIHDNANSALNDYDGKVEVVVSDALLGKALELLAQEDDRKNRVLPFTVKLPSLFRRKKRKPRIEESDF